MGREVFSIRFHAFWCRTRSPGFHRDFKTGCRFSSATRTSSSRVSWRYSDYRQLWSRDTKDNQHTNAMSFSLPLGKKESLLVQCNKAYKSKTLTLRELASLLGILNWASQSVEYASAHIGIYKPSIHDKSIWGRWFDHYSFWRGQVWLKLVDKTG